MTTERPPHTNAAMDGPAAMAWPAGWRRVLVYGLGLSGLGAVALLRRHGLGVVACDARDGDAVKRGALAEDPAVEWRLGSEPEALDDAIDAVVVSPGVPLDRPLLETARGRGVPVLAEVELAFALVDGPVVAITGSNGKSTTTAMAGAMLSAGGYRAEVCGNIGEPLSRKVLDQEAPKNEARGRIFVVELSSFQLETVDRFHAGAAALLNLSPDHLDRHADFAEYRAAKVRIFERQTSADLAVLNADDPELARLATAAHRRLFSSRRPVDDGCELRGDTVWEVGPEGEQPLFHVGDVPLPGHHNLENAMAAALLARAHGVEPAAITGALRGFRGLTHRLERVRERGGVTWYDDSKGTNLAATVRSLGGFEDGKVHVVLGGCFKGGELAELVEVVGRKARQTYLIGESAEIFARALDAAGIANESLGTLEKAVTRIAEVAKPGEIALLSPACSSFDQFTNFAERGRIFQRLVHELAPVATDGAGGGDGP